MPRHHRRLATFAMSAAMVAACSDGGPAGPSGTDGGAPPIPAQGSVVVVGRVMAAIERAPMAGLTVSAADQQRSSGPDGRFWFEWPPRLNPSTLALLITGPNIVPRSVVIATDQSRELELDAIAFGGGFDLDYYRRLVRGALSQPTLQPLARWTRAPSVYIRTLDEAGLPVPAPTLDLVAAVVSDDVTGWTGGRFGLAGVERGPETREGMAGWVTIKWSNPRPVLDRCGIAQVGVEGGWVEFNPQLDVCGCDGSRIGAGIVRHEMGHVFGFYHTGVDGDLLASRLDQDETCHGRMSSRERLHAAIAYGRPVGNRDPDADPSSSVIQRITTPVLVVD